MMGTKIKDKDLVKGIFNSSEIGILVVDGKGRIIKANPTSETMFGYNPGELCGINAEVLLPKQLREPCRDLREQFAKGPNVKKSWQGLDLWGLRKNGSRFPLEVSLSPIIDKKLTIAFVIDISDRTRLEKKIKAAEPKTKAILPNLPDSDSVQAEMAFEESKERLRLTLEAESFRFWDGDMQDELRNYAAQLEKKVQERTNELTTTVQKLVESNLKLEKQAQETKAAEARALANQALYSAIAQHFPNGIIVVVNKSFQFVSMHGEDMNKLSFDRESMIGVTVDQLETFSQERKDRMRKELQKTLGGEHLCFEIEHNGNSYEINSMPLYNNFNEVEQALFVYTNITKRKKVEQNIINALNKEKELNELKSRFISMASHEFRTPLSTILSAATLISKQNEPGKEEKRIGYVQRIKSNVRNLVIILNDFLSLGKLEEGKIVVLPDAFDLIGLSRSLIEEIESSCKRGQTFKLVTSHQLIEVVLDEKMVRHVLQNLLSNAVKYSAENKCIVVGINQCDEQILIQVTDQGIGIPTDEQGNLFDRFFRARNVANIQGTGLGLHIVKKYIELMGGTIRFTSTLSKGTTFSVILPLKQEKYEKNIT